MDEQAQKYIPCNSCHGTGKKYLNLFGQCDMCEGTGKRINYPRITSICHEIYLDNIVNLSRCLTLAQEAEQLLPNEDEAQPDSYQFKQAWAEVYYWKGCVLMELQQYTEALSSLKISDTYFDKSDVRYSFLQQSLNKLALQTVKPAAVKDNVSILDKVKRTSTHIGQTLRETDWAGKGTSALDQAGKAVKKVASSAASQAGQFLVENKDTVRKAGQAVVEKTLATGKSVGAVGQMALQTKAKADSVTKTLKNSIVIISVVAVVCAISVTALVVYQFIK
jgi:hypothetical protein